MRVVLIAGSTGSALRAVRPPNLHITGRFQERISGQLPNYCAKLRVARHFIGPHPAEQLSEVALQYLDFVDRDGVERGDNRVQRSRPWNGQSCRQNQTRDRPI
jgi:hypothetical protein